ncbi:MULTISPECIES: hypothetical protein [unclassified Haematospirillum]|uniref:hypothetical protein n=1 Tax=unclassified Haematospirillum TaxID=2622088 RepID=UPI00143A9322|nr:MULTISPECIES: hypothetical protein [unclassified Haematospirillum]NKD55788.1 hypothetical protein [Haematospirillum sp. H4890]NKD75901.1 hypothetical protein [Haematospirillum sp. H4485]NKD87920.1 hypothetical protein [Haematospirillum sp. 15-248]
MPSLISDTARRAFLRSVRSNVLAKRRTMAWEDPDLETLLDDPLIMAVMNRDGVRPDDVRAAFEAARANLSH